MGLFDKLFDVARNDAASKSAKPAVLEITPAPGVLYAPVSGKVVAMSSVPDPAFSDELLGKGCGIWPETETVFAPVSGTISVLMGHAVGMVSDGGIEVLVHVGMDTVSLEGKGFTAHVAQGEHVVAGQPLLSFSKKVIADTGFADCVVLAVSNSAAYEEVALTVVDGAIVEAGSSVVRVK